MKFKNYLIVFIAIVLLLIMYFLFKNTKNSTLGIDSYAFAVSDTAEIDKIFLADRSGNTALLERKTPAIWEVNKKFIARKDAINTLLYTFKNLHIKAPVPLSARNTVIKDIAAIGIKVEIYKKGILYKTYYVGRETQDNLGTYMISENDENAYIMDIPGFNGYLTPRYIVSEEEWRSQSIFNYTPGEIKKLRMENNIIPENSFEINVVSMDKIAITDIQGKEIQNFDKQMAFSFLSRFQNINFESFAKLDEHAKDSVFNSIPIFKISITEKSGKLNELKIFRKYAIPGEAVQTGSDGKPSPFDIARMYARKNEEKELVLVQNFVFDRILPSKKDFIRKE